MTAASSNTPTRRESSHAAYRCARERGTTDLQPIPLVYDRRQTVWDPTHELLDNVGLCPSSAVPSVIHACENRSILPDDTRRLDPLHPGPGSHSAAGGAIPREPTLQLPPAGR